MEDVQHSPQNSTVLLNQLGSASSIFLPFSFTQPVLSSREHRGSAAVAAHQRVHGKCTCSCSYIGLEHMKIGGFACVCLRPTVMLS